MKKLMLFSLVLLSVICIITSVYAAGSFSVTVQTNKNEFSKNEEFTVEFNLSNMQVSEGIITMNATLEYDKDSLTVVNTEGQNGWGVTYNDATGILFLDNSALIKDNGGFLKVTFKVKENSKANLTIGLKDITASGGEGDIIVANVEKTIVIKTDSTDNGNNNGDNNNGGNNNGGNNNGSNNNGNNNGSNNNGGNNNSNNNGNNNSNNNNNSNSNNNNSNKISNTNTENNTIASGKLPQTGEGNIALIVCIGLVIACSVISYIKMK